MKRASEILAEAADTIRARAELRDTDHGERSMRRAVAAYVALSGGDMRSELDGWRFMVLLKLARATAGKHHIDDYIDAAGYCALAAESISIRSVYPFDQTPTPWWAHVDKDMEDQSVKSD